MAALIGLVVGAVLALVFQPTVSPEQSRFLAVIVVAALDAAFGGIRSMLDKTFSDRVFVVSFASNAALAVGLVWIGDQLGVNFVTAVAVVFGIRIFQNMSAIRRRIFGG
ncbi:MAG: small basic family protein [Acidimicrobiia bacterium]